MLDKEQRAHQEKLGNLQKELSVLRTDKSNLENIRIQVDCEKSVLDAKRDEIDKKLRDVAQVHNDAGKPIDN